MPDGIIFKVRVQPRASRNAIAGLIGGAVKIQLTSPPVEGAANAACIDYLARLFAIAKSRVVILAGDKSRNKIVKISGIDKKEFLTKMASIV
ncbi:MAG: DUF167 domain-containing protein [Negativicutes bacterium]|nr:DUF167 domain-containing protein [Negativicutes bacterium]